MARCCPHWPSTRPVPPTGKGSATLNWRRRRRRRPRWISQNPTWSWGHRKSPPAWPPVASSISSPPPRRARSSWATAGTACYASTSSMAPATWIPCHASTDSSRCRWSSPSLQRTCTFLMAKTLATSTSSMASSIRTRRRCARSSRPWCGGGSPSPPYLAGSGTATSSLCRRGSANHKHGMVFGHALVDDSICFSICGAEGAGTYCFHIPTREWSKAGDWLMPFNGKADYVPELGLWFGITQDNHPCAADLSGLVRGEELSPDKMRIWERDDLPEEWQPKSLHNSCAVSLGSGRFIIVDFLNVMKFNKEWNEMDAVKEFALFTGMELAFSNGKGKNGRNGASKDNGHHSSGTHCSGNESCNCSVSGNKNGGKGKGVMRGLRVIKHKSHRYMFKKQLRIEAVL
ncbi:hypothetical protein VPH35_041304 [Triticum aestivum]